MIKYYQQIAIYKNRLLRFAIPVVFIAVLVASACKKPYSPPLAAGGTNYLVVDGVVNTSGDSSFIKISRTGGLADKIQLNTEHGAKVSVISDVAEYPFVEKESGTYASAGLNLDASRKYRLKIITGDSQQYLSDEIEMKDAPAIDDVVYKPNGNALDIFVNTHDASNNSRYYRWDFVEDWAFHSKYRSEFIYEKSIDELRLRQPEEEVYNCFGHAVSNTIALASTVKLSQDVVSNARITTIAASSLKLSVRYSILVKQYAISKEAYDFWENLKKNTEQLGGIFDAQPSELRGNIHNVNNPDEPVIGYISGGKAQTKRIYINKEDLPDWTPGYPQYCLLDTARFQGPNGQDEVRNFIINGENLAVYAVYIKTTVIGYTRTPKDCADCTLNEGKKTAPAFWQDK